MSAPRRREIDVRLVKDPLHKRILARPFRYYARMGGATFCLVMATNFATTLANPERRAKHLVAHPQLFWWGLSTKSAFFAAVWPAWYLTALSAPRDAFEYHGLEVE